MTVKTFTLKQIRERLAGELSSGDASFSRVSIDSRSLSSGDLFVAIKGPNFDGHNFIEKVAESGAAAAVVSDAETYSIPSLRVTDTRLALGQLGALNREHFSGQVLAVTGSAGKTTVKQMAASILNQCGSVLATHGNFNNEIGVPLTLLDISAEHQYVVMELGASSIGEIAYTVSLTKPDVAIITNAVDAHIEGFGSLNNVVQAKGEIIDGLASTGIAVINSDDLNAYKWIQRAGDRPCITFSLDETAGSDFYATNYRINEAHGGYDFELVAPTGSIEICLKQLGLHNVANALAAAAGTSALGATLEQIKTGLEQTDMVAGRLFRRAGVNGALVIDDSYNANPESLRAAIDVLCQYSGRKILVLGDMAELGDMALRAHVDSARYALDQGVDQFIAMGNLSAHAARIFGDRGSAYDSKELLSEMLRKIMNKNTTVLVKGSRSARMEEVVTAITGGER